MKKHICIIFLVLITVNINAQDSLSTERELRFPAWITHSKNTDIVGLSLGFFPTDYNSVNHLTRSYGIRLEAFPLSFLYFLAPRSPISTSEKAYLSTLKGHVTQKIYGLNISTGTFESIDAYGISLTGFMHYSRKNNGIAIAGMTNSIERANGLVIGFGGNGVYEGNGIMLASVWGNETMRFNGLQISGFNSILEKGTGIQIGLWNTAKNFRGIQLGLWNKNDKRSLPLINWQFRK